FRRALYHQIHGCRTGSSRFARHRRCGFQRSRHSRRASHTHRRRILTHFSQTSDSRGETHFLALTPATYAVEVTARGFAEQTQRVAVSISAQPVVRIVLAPESLRQSVEV